MVNRRRGEVTIVLDGSAYRLLLTLGALAELENAFAVEDLQALGARFSTGRLSSSDLSVIVGAGLRGAGHDIDDLSLARMRPDGGLPAVAQAVAELLRITFLGDEPDGDARASAQEEGNTPQNP